MICWSGVRSRRGGPVCPVVQPHVPVPSTVVDWRALAPQQRALQCPQLCLQPCPQIVLNCVLSDVPGCVPTHAFHPCAPPPPHAEAEPQAGALHGRPALRAHLAAVQVGGGCKYEAPWGHAWTRRTAQFLSTWSGWGCPCLPCVPTLCAPRSVQQRCPWAERLPEPHPNTSKPVYRSVNTPVYRPASRFHPSFHSAAPGAKLLAAIVPALNATRLLLVGSGVVRDDGLVRSVSRSGDRGELLKVRRTERWR